MHMERQMGIKRQCFDMVISTVIMQRGRDRQAKLKRSDEGKRERVASRDV